MTDIEKKIARAQVEISIILTDLNKHIKVKDIKLSNELVYQEDQDCKLTYLYTHKAVKIETE